MNKAILLIGIVLILLVGCNKLIDKKEDNDTLFNLDEKYVKNQLNRYSNLSWVNENPSTIVRNNCSSIRYWRNGTEEIYWNDCIGST